MLPLGDEKVPPMPPLESAEVTEGKESKIVPPNKLLIRLPILLTQVKGGYQTNTISFVSL